MLTYHNDNQHTGQNLTETRLAPANVRSAGFGKLFTFPVDGKVDAQPLVVSRITIAGQSSRNVVFTATEHDSVYAFDADSGTAYWHVSMLKAGEAPSDPRSCGQVVPEIGVTATPVIDLQAGPHGTIYLIAMSKDAGGRYHHRLHALDITTGAEQFGGPVEIQATYPGTGDGTQGGRVVFNPGQYKERSALLLVNGIIYTSWSSHCDIRPYTGWTIGYNKLTLSQTGVFNFTPNGNEAAIWGAGSGVAADTAGNLYVQTGNGTFETTLNARGFPNKGDFGNAFVKVGLVNGTLTALDYWTMFNTVAESSIDQDLGSGGPLLLPDVVDAAGRTRHLGVGAGKDRHVYVFDRDNLGKFNPSNNTNLYQELPSVLNGGEFAMPAWYNGQVYFGAVGDVIHSFKVTAGKLGTQPSSSSPTSYPYPGATPAISANGSSNGILWAVANSNPAVLHAYDANDLVTELYNSSQAPAGRDQFGPGNKFIVPAIANGKVFIGTPNSVAVFGLLPFKFETESLSHTTSGPPLDVIDWSGFPNGVGTKLSSAKVGDSVTFTVNVPAARAFDVRANCKTYNLRGTFQLAVNGVNVGPVTDEYASAAGTPEFDLGTVTIPAAGNAAFRFTVTGKNAASSGFSLAFDYIKLIPK